TVTGVCSARNTELVRSLGADSVIDYAEMDYTEAGTKYDVIVDNVGNHGLFANRRALTPEGKYVQVGGGGPDEGLWFGPLLRPIGALLMRPFVSQDMTVMLADLNRDDLTILAKLMQDGRVTPVID